MMIKKKFSAALILLSLSFVLCAADLQAFGKRSVGTAGAQFLKLGVNARAVGMGEAYSSVTDGADAIYWNPAGLAKVEKQAISVMHAVHFADISYDFASYACRINPVGTFAIGFQYLGAGSIDQVDENNMDAGSFKPYDMAVSFGLARKVTDFDSDQEFLLGLSGKIIQSKIIESATSGACDMGVGWNALSKLWLSLAVQNIGSSVRFVSEGDDLPLNVKLGSSYTLFKSLIVAADVNIPKDNDVNGAFGAEYKQMLSEQGAWCAGRAGFNTRTTQDVSKLSSISAGAGLGFNSYGIDFAWVPFGSVGQSYKISLSAKF